MKPGDEEKIVEGCAAKATDLSLDMWYCLSNNASIFKMFGYNLHPAKKQECLLNQAFEGRL
jgi:hypothetical protein